MPKIRPLTRTAKVQDRIAKEMKYIRTELRENKIRHREIAEILGKTQPAVTMQLNGTHEMSFETYITAKMLLEHEL